LKRMAANRMEELERLLNKCTDGFVPDYATFYQEAADILNKPGSDTFLEVLRSTADEFARSCMSESSFADPKARIKSFQKVKLFFGLINYLREPVRSVFTAVIQ